MHKTTFERNSSLGYQSHGLKKKKGKFPGEHYVSELGKQSIQAKKVCYVAYALY